MDSRREEIKKERKRREFKKMIWLCISIMLTYAIFAGVAVVLIEKNISIDEKDQWNWGWMIISIEILHLYLSLKKVGPQELGAVLIFGRPLYQVKSGLVYVPFVICQLSKDDGTVISIQYPAEPEKIDKTGLDDRPVLPGFMKPIRITTASIDTIPKEFMEGIKKRINISDKFYNDPLNGRMTLEPVIFIRFQIRRDDYISFLTHLGDIEKTKTAIRDTVDAVLNIEFSKRTPILILMDIEDINKEIKNSLEILIGEIPDPKDPDSFNPEESWGIDVLRSQLTEIDLTKKINVSLRDIIDSNLRINVTIKDAEGRKVARGLDGEGENKFETEKGIGLANARESFLNAEAKGLEKITEIAKSEEGKLVIVTKATEQGLKGSQYTIIPDGAGSIIAGIMETMKKTKSHDTLTINSEDKTIDKIKKSTNGGKK